MNDMKKKYIQYMISSLMNLDRSFELSDKALDLKNSLISELENQLESSIDDEIKIYNNTKESLNTVKIGINTIYGNKHGINDKIDELYNHIDSCINKLANHEFDDSYSIDLIDKEIFMQELVYIHDISNMVKDNISRVDNHEYGETIVECLLGICDNINAYIMIITKIKENKKE